jgi:hypothetical protein
MATVIGTGTAANGNGVQGTGFAPQGTGVQGTSTDGSGVVGTSTGGSGVEGTSSVGSGVVGTSGLRNGVEGTSTDGSGVVGTSTSGSGVVGESNGSGVMGISTSGIGVEGSSTDGIGVHGFSTNANGVQGIAAGEAILGGSRFASGVYGENLSVKGYGVAGRSNAPIWPDDSAAAVFGENPNGLAGLFNGYVWVSRKAIFFGGVELNGTVDVNGALEKHGANHFKIDHPLDPPNKYLLHSAVESPDMMNVYNGNVSTDAEGNATVELPSYFEALNRDFRYQLTPIGEFAQAIVAEEVKDNRFTIKTDKPDVRVSWQITGIRQDAWANAHPMEVEAEKPDGERGKYLSPEEHGQPAMAGMFYRDSQVFDRTEADGDQRQAE